MTELSTNPSPAHIYSVYKLVLWINGKESHFEPIIIMMGWSENFAYITVFYDGFTVYFGSHSTWNRPCGTNISK